MYSRPVAAGVPLGNSRRCSLATETAPERPPLVTQVSCRPTPRSISRPPLTSPPLAECTNTVAPPAVARAGPGDATSSPAATATSPATLQQNQMAKAAHPTARRRPCPPKPPSPRRGLAGLRRQSRLCRARWTDSGSSTSRTRCQRPPRQNGSPNGRRTRTAHGRSCSIRRVARGARTSPSAPPGWSAHPSRLSRRGGPCYRKQSFWRGSDAREAGVLTRPAPGIPSSGKRRCCAGDSSHCGASTAPRCAVQFCGKRTGGSRCWPRYPATGRTTTCS